MKLGYLLYLVSAVAAAAGDTCAGGECPASGPAAGFSLIAIRSVLGKRGQGTNGESAAMNIDGIETAAALIDQVWVRPAGPDPKPRRALVQQLAALHITPHLRAFLKATNATIKSLIGNNTEAASNDTILRDKMHATFGGLAKDFTTSKSTIQGLMEAGIAARKQLATCRAEEGGLFTDKTTCILEADLLSNEVEKTLTAVGAQQGAQKLLCGNSGLGAANSNDAYVALQDLKKVSDKFLKVKENHTAKAGLCDTLTASHSAKTVECDTKQGVFEAAVCQHFTTSETECEVYTAAYTTKLADYELLCDSIDTREAQRIAEVKNLKRVNCVVEALVTGIADQSALVKSIEACYKKAFDTAGLVMQPKAAPSPESCPVSPTAVPCSSAFANEEYGALPKGVAAATCKGSCEVTTTTTTTTITATTTTTVTATTTTITATTTTTVTATATTTTITATTTIKAAVWSTAMDTTYCNANWGADYPPLWANTYTLQQCKDLCATAATCQGISFGTLGYAGKCVLCSSVASTASHSSWTFYRFQQARMHPVAYYPMDDCSNTKFSSGAASGNVQFSESCGIFGKGACFSSGSYCHDDYFKNFAWADFSSCAWVRRTGGTSNYAGIVTTGYLHQGAWEIRVGREGCSSGTCNNLGSSVNQGGGSWDISGLQLKMNTWTHLCLTSEGDVEKFYINGQKAGEKTRSSAAIAAKNQPLFIGTAKHGSENFDGHIDEVKIYLHALTATEVMDVYSEV